MLSINKFKDMKKAYVVYEVNLYEQEFGSIDSDDVLVAVFLKENLAKEYIQKYNSPSSFMGVQGDGELYYEEKPLLENTDCKLNNVQ